MKVSYGNFLHKTFLPFCKENLPSIIKNKFTYVSTPAENNREERNKSGVTNCEINK